MPIILEIGSFSKPDITHSPLKLDFILEITPCCLPGTQTIQPISRTLIRLEECWLIPTTTFQCYNQNPTLAGLIHPDGEQIVDPLTSNKEKWISLFHQNPTIQYLAWPPHKYNHSETQSTWPHPATQIEWNPSKPTLPCWYPWQTESLTLHCF